MNNTKHKIEYALVSKAKKGNKEALNQLCQLKARSILYASISLAGNIHDAEDLSQNVILRVYTSLDKLKKSASFDAWLYRVIHNEFLSYLKKKNSGGEYSVEGLLSEEIEFKRENLPEYYLEDSEKRKLLQELLDELPAENRYCLVMFYFEDMSYKEIAEVLGKTEKDVKNIMYRSKIRMRNSLSEKESVIEKTSNFAMIFTPAVMGVYMKQQASALSTEALVPALETAMAQLPIQSATGLVSMKVATAIVSVTAVAVVATAGITINDGFQAIEKTPSMSASIVVKSESVVIEDSSIFTIESLEDMLGAENAQLLRQFVISPPSSSEWQSFLQKTGLTSLYESKEESTHYTLYALEKQDKRLMVIVKQKGLEEIQGLVYNFDTIEKPIPTYYEVIQSYETW